MKAHFITSPTRRIALALSILTAPVLCAQDVYLQNMYEDLDYRQRGLFDGLEGGEEEYVDEKIGEEGSWTDFFHLSLAGGFRYDSNVYLDSSDEKSDVIFTISPTLSFETGKAGSSLNTFSIAYTPSFITYFDNSRDDALDHRVSMRYTKQLAKSKIAFDLDFTDNNNSDDRFRGGVVSRTRWNGALRYNYILTGKTRLDLVGDFDLNDFHAPGYFDQNTVGLRASVLYQMTGKTALGPSFSYHHTNVSSGGNNQDSYNMGLKADYIASGKTVLTGTLGYNIRTFDGTAASNNENTMTWSIGARYQATGKTMLNTTFYREPKVSFNFVNTGYMATGLSLSARHQYSERINFFSIISYENDDYYEMATTGTSLENNYYTLTLGGNYQMPSSFTIGANMTWRTNDSNSTFNEFDDFTCGINASYKFW